MKKRPVSHYCMNAPGNRDETKNCPQCKEEKVLGSSKPGDLFQALLEEHITHGAHLDNNKSAKWDSVYRKVEALRKECGI